MREEKNIKTANDRIETGKTTLSLSQLWLGEVPVKVKELKKLSKLDLSYNNLTELPEFVFELKKLRHLKLKGNNIEHLSESIGNLKLLRTLDIESNNIEKLPDSFCKLDNLEEINCESGGLAILPEDIGKLKKLKILDLGRCPIEVIPESIGELKELIRFNLTLTNVKKLPESIGGLKKLEQLSLLYAKLTEIPAQISELTSLTALAIAGMERCENFPEDLTKLKDLENLFLKDSNLQSIPKGVFTIPNIRFLRMENNSLTELPEDLAGMKHLSGLFFGNNKIKEIPEFLSKKEWLTIDLSSNKIGENSFPENFRDISVKNLNLTGNPISELTEAPKSFSKHDGTKISGINFKIRRENPDRFRSDIDKKVKEYASNNIENLRVKLLNRINKPLMKWGGKDNQLLHFDDFQTVFLKELLEKKIKNLKKQAKISFQDFFGDSDLKVLMDIQEIELPSTDSNIWNITINNRDFTGPLVIFKMDGWDILEETMVG